MNNLFYNSLNGYQQQNAFNRANYSLTRAGEPISVNGEESVTAFPTLPNTKTILFHQSEPLFYCKTTDDTNFPIVKTYRYYEEIKSSPQHSQFVTHEELNKFKEEVLNEQHLWSNTNAQPTALAHGEQHPSGTETGEFVESKSESSTNASITSKPESSIW